MTTDEKIGQLVKRLRKKRQMTQISLAKELGLDQSALSRIENGVQKLTAAQLIQVSEILKANAARFLS